MKRQNYLASRGRWGGGETKFRHGHGTNEPPSPLIILINLKASALRAGWAKMNSDKDSE